MFLDYFALFLVFFVAIVLFYGIIAIHDIPYEIAVHRNHPHQDAIHVAGWVSLFTLHVMWPFLWVWAALYREDRGWGFSHGKKPKKHPDPDDEGRIDPAEQQAMIAQLSKQVDTLTEQVTQLQKQVRAGSHQSDKPEA